MKGALLHSKAAEAGMPTAVEWLREFLKECDTSQLSRLSVKEGTRTYGANATAVYGRCEYPRQGIRTGPKATYRISCFVPGPFPASIKARRRAVYRTYVENISEAIVWIVSHELFHFLCKTKQILGRDTEIEADTFADARLAEFVGARRNHEEGRS